MSLTWTRVVDFGHCFSQKVHFDLYVWYMFTCNRNVQWQFLSHSLRFFRRFDFITIPYSQYHLNSSFARTSIRQNQCFLGGGTSTWNGLPPELCPFSRTFSVTFFSLLNTVLFSRAGVSEKHLGVVLFKGRYINVRYELMNYHYTVSLWVDHLGHWFVMNRLIKLHFVTFYIFSFCSRNT